MENNMQKKVAEDGAVNGLAEKKERDRKQKNGKKIDADMSSQNKTANKKKDNDKNGVKKLGILFKTLTVAIIFGSISAGIYYGYNLSQEFLGIKERLAKNRLTLEQIDSIQDKINKSVGKFQKNIDDIDINTQKKIDEISLYLGDLRNKIKDIETELTEITEKVSNRYKTENEQEAAEQSGKDSIVETISDNEENGFGETVIETAIIGEDSETKIQLPEIKEKTVITPSQLNTAASGLFVYKDSLPVSIGKTKFTVIDKNTIDKMIDERIERHLKALDIRRKKLKELKRKEKIRRKKEGNERIVIAMEEVVKTIVSELKNGLLFLKKTLYETIL